MFTLDYYLSADNYKILTRFYHEYLGIGVTTGSKRPHSDMIPRVRFKRPVAVHSRVHIRRDLLAVDVLADHILDGFYVSVISNEVR